MVAAPAGAFPETYSLHASRPCTTRSRADARRRPFTQGKTAERLYSAAGFRDLAGILEYVHSIAPERRLALWGRQCLLKAGVEGVVCQVDEVSQVV